ncbi:RTA1-like protein [Crepidotus variabilis]|uniref:RTA1-like protein n=1 Tax=Crepidotus variabilis TaxID=179855 RepID=A0A9P6ETK2_9AGAR|nr:RTA1-like protein [Crepidotus variabilis]
MVNGIPPNLPPDVVKQIIEDNSPYNYIPSQTVAIIVLVLFSVSTITHVAQAAWFRTWWLLPTAAFCGIIEILGWSGRLWSSISPFLEIPFQIQITCTIVAPTPLLAANFVIFGRIIERLGSQYSRLTPKWYTIIFCTCDVISLVIQGIGGGLAATADTLENANKGGNIMLGGIAFQLGVIIIFTLCATEFFIRYFKGAPIRAVQPGSRSTGEFTSRLKIMTGAMSFVTVVLFIRAIYRTIELSDGWNGRIIATQVYFNVLDGAMVILAIYTYNIFHPGLLLHEPGRNSSSENVTQVHYNANENESKPEFKPVHSA